MAEKKEQKRVPGYKSENQKYKSLLVMQYILKNADDEHAVTIGQIEDHLAKSHYEASELKVLEEQTPAQHQIGLCRCCLFGNVPLRTPYIRMRFLFCERTV